MRILLSSAGPLQGPFGGGQTYVMNLAITLVQRGHRVLLVAPSTSAVAEVLPDPARETIHGAELVHVPVSASPSIGGGWRERNDALLRGLNDIVVRFRPDVVHANGLKSALATIALETTTPFVATVHHAGVVCPAGALLTPSDRVCDLPADPRWCVACFCQQRKAGRTLGRALGMLPPAIYRPLGRSVGALRRPGFVGRALMYPLEVERTIEDRLVALRGAQRWIAPSRAIRHALLLNGVEESRIDLVPHGIAPCERRSIEGVESRPVRFGYVGQINRPKGVHVLLQAFARLPTTLGCELHIVGAPQRPGEREYLEKWLRACRGRTIVQHGRIERDQIAAAIHRFDVLVVPSICLEVFGLVVLEAHSAGRPVIVSDCGGLKEIVRSEVDGLVVRGNDVAALHGAMERLARDPGEVRRLESGIGAVRTLDQHVSDVERVYERVCGDVRERRGVREASHDQS